MTPPARFSLRAAIFPLCLVGALVFGSGAGAQSARLFDFDRDVTPWRVVVGGEAGFSFSHSTELPWRGDGSAILERDANTDAAGVGAAAAVLPAQPYRGRTIRMTAMARTRGPDADLSGLWLRIDREGGAPGFFDNMADRPLRAHEWTEISIIGPVAADAARMMVGVIRSGRGSIEIDDVTIEILTEDEGERVRSAAAADYMETALAALERHHLRRGAVDWAVLRAQAVAEARSAESPDDLHDAIERVIVSLGEPHTRLRRPANAQVSSPSDPPSANRSGDIVQMFLPGVTTFGRAPSVAEDYEAAVRALVDTGSAACGIILDLRGNAGGDMWPMLNGLRDILGPPPYGFFVDAGGNAAAWAVDDNGRVALVPDPKPSAPAESRLQSVAVLVGPGTASSGELVALAFRGREGSRLFGAPTAGLTSANIPVALPDGAYLSITSALAADRNMTVVSGPLQPDEAAADESPAVAWLREQGCRG